MIRSPNRRGLRTAALALMLGAAAPALAQPAAQPVEETNRYRVRLMIQIFDGSREFSHTQLAALARMRKGDESWVKVDFGDSAVVVDRAGRKQVGSFRNTSGAEQGMRYDYATNALTGDPAVADFHNRYVRRLLGGGPALGSDATWTKTLTLGDIGFRAIIDAPLEIQFERRYFTHAGKNYALVHYRIPSFTYSDGGRAVVHWGEGVAVTDASFGEIFWNAALHRAVRTDDNGVGRPYRYAKTIVALDAAGKPAFDPRDVAETAKYVDAVYGASTKEIMGFVDAGADAGSSDAMPVDVATKLDILSLSIAENSANQLGELTGAYAGGGRGSETSKPLPAPLSDEERRRTQSELMRRATDIAGDGPATGRTNAEKRRAMLNALQAAARENAAARSESIPDDEPITNKVRRRRVRDPSSNDAVRGGTSNPGNGAGLPPAPEGQPSAATASTSARVDDAYERVKVARERFDADPSAANKAALANAAGELERLSVMLMRQAAHESSAVRDELTDKGRRYKDYAIASIYQPDQPLRLREPGEPPELDGGSGNSLVSGGSGGGGGAGSGGGSGMTSGGGGASALTNAYGAGGGSSTGGRGSRALTSSPLATSPLAIAPVTFDPPKFDPPTFDPPTWVPPVFDPPKASDIPFTNFDDDDFPNTGNLAFDYDGLSGTVETDLGRWAEWLKTQNIRELERLALQIGYPNLASALADAQNLIRQASDPGYRRWASQAPSCGGLAGCGPSYLERWAAKQAVVALGDILAASREIFSTGGFSDIGISGFSLAYLLRDHQLEDGDLVRVRISQFGRVIYEGQVNLTNLGEQFSQLLRPGVASLEILALNEGFSPPNTAQISIDNVVRGEGTQSYSLRTGETATLRIEANAGTRP